MGMLKSTWQASQGIEKKFKYKSILFIPSESYDAATITVLQGLERLGFVIYTIGKPNINSWFVNEVIEDPSKVKFDFVLSNLHWGNKWSLYKYRSLLDRFKVLIDGCDNRQSKNWREKYEKYRKRYSSVPSGATMEKELQPYRWMESLYGYEPDLVFTSQKPFGDKTCYLPFGIRREYLRLREGKSGRERRIDFAHFPGPGSGRKRLTDFLARTKLPGAIHNEKARGVTESSLGTPALFTALQDNNVHSWHRWLEYPDYFKVLNDTKVLIYPNVYTNRAHWDSARIWEAYASGCLVLLEKPNVDMAQYPVTELCKEAQYTEDLVGKCKRLYRNQGRLEQLRLQAVEGALRYFSPVALARYFLWKILFEQKGRT